MKCNLSELQQLDQKHHALVSNIEAVSQKWTSVKKDCNFTKVGLHGQYFAWNCSTIFRTPAANFFFNRSLKLLNQAKLLSTYIHFLLHTTQGKFYKRSI